MNIDQAGSDNFASGVDNLGAFVIKPFADRDDLALFDQDIAGFIKLLRRADHPSAFNQYFSHSSHQFLISRLNRWFALIRRH